LLLPELNRNTKRTVRGTFISVAIVLAACLSAALAVRSTILYPRTDDAEVVANFIGIAPVVDGPVVQLPVQDNQFVRKGSLLYKIDDRPYLYALQNALAAQSALEGEIENESRRIAAQVSTVEVAHAGTESARANQARAEDDVKVGEAGVKQAEAALQQATAESDYAAGNLRRIEPLLAKHFVTPDEVHRARALAEAKSAAVEQAQSQLALSKARLLSATADKQRAIAMLTQSQAQVAQSSHAVSVLSPLIAQRESRAAAVSLAKYNYEQCSVVAPFDARVTNLTISEGEYVKAGQKLFTLIDTRAWWILANFRETQLTYVQPGLPVDIYLMSNTRSRLQGKVESVGFGVTPDPDVVGRLSPGLPDVQRTLNWVRLASRYPVRIRVIDPPPATLRVGQVAVVVLRPAKQ
jgi:membrane fusion protein, multidrug efflux system